MANYAVLTLASPGESYSQLLSTQENEYVITLETAERQVNFILTSTALDDATCAGFAVCIEKAFDYISTLGERLTKKLIGRPHWLTWIFRIYP